MACIRPSSQKAVQLQPKVSNGTVTIDELLLRSKQAKADLLALKGQAPSKADLKIIDEKEMNIEVRKAFSRNMTETELAVQIQALKHLGIIPDAIDTPQKIFELYSKSAMAIYDPWSKKLLIKDSLSRMDLDDTIPHEWVHALQDERFNLKHYSSSNRLSPQKGLSDKDRARSFVIEGDANASIMLLKSQRNKSAKGIDNLKELIVETRQIPFMYKTERDPKAIFIRLMLMPYTEGAHTILQVYETGGWAGVDALMKNLPTSTEQMMHYEKLSNREVFDQIRLNEEKLPEDWSLLYADSLGEAALLAMLGDAMPEKEARAAAAGWNGDRFAYIQKGNVEKTIIGVTSWDSIGDAIAFEHGLRLFLKKTSSRATFISRENHLLWYAIGDIPPNHRTLFNGIVGLKKKE